MSDALSNSHQTSNMQQLHATKANDNNTSSTKANRTNIIIYSGACIYYQKIWVENNGEHEEHLKPISKGFAKAVFNRQKKAMYFYYNNKLVHSFKDYDSYMDDKFGGEGYSFDASADGHRFIAERVFQLNTNHLLSEPGFQYDIINYKEN